MTDINNVSHTFVRDPSIVYPGIRPLPALRKKLFKSFDGTFGDSKKEPIKIFLRIKPVLHKENVFVPPESHTFKVVNGTTLTARCVKQTSHGKSLVSHRYTFTKIFEGDVDQRYLFQNSVQDAVRDFVNGRNALLFAYGTTNAGKTHTMIGDALQPGIIPRSIHVLFNAIQGNLGSLNLKPCNVNSVVELDKDALANEVDFKNRILQWNPQAADTTNKTTAHSHVSDDSCLSKRLANTLSDDTCGTDFISYSFRDMEDRLKDDTFDNLTLEDGTRYTVWVSFAEVYNESIFDLLEPRPGKDKERKTLVLGCDNQGHAFIKGLHCVPVLSGDEAYHVMLYGKHNLRCSATNLNDVSSRSHCIFTIKLVRSPDVASPTHASVSSYSFCDLAGSERVKKTLNEGKQLTESININTSLLVLGKCLKAIRDNQKGQGRLDQSMIPFRESKLTRLFHRAMLGHETVAMVVNISTDPVLLPETLHVLKFSAIAKQIVLEPPARQRPIKQSTRFSQIATKHSKRLTIAWEMADGDMTGTTNQSDGDMSRRDEGPNQALLNLVEDLKKQLKSERKKNLSLEINVRKELTDKFTEMMEEVEVRHKQSLEEMEIEKDQFLHWRTKDMEQFYEKSSKRKRNCDEGDRPDMSIARDLQDEVDSLQQENEVLRELHEKAVQQTEKLRIANTRLEFESANNLQLLTAANQTIETINPTSGDPLVADLQNRLAAATAEISAKDRSIQDLKELLDEAKLEYIDITTNNHNLETDIAKWEQVCAEKEDALEEALLSCTQSQMQFNKYKASKKLEIKNMNATIAEHQDRVSQLERVNVQELKPVDADKESEALRKKLSSLEEQLSNLQINPKVEEETRVLLAELESVRTENHSLQREVETLRDANNAQLDNNNEVGNLEKEVKKLLQVNRELQQVIDSKNHETHTLEVQLKQAVKASTSAEEAYRLEVENTQTMKMNFQCEVERLRMKDEDFLRTLQQEDEKRIAELAHAKEENETLLEQIAAMSTDLEQLKDRRDKQFKQYEDMIRREKDEVDRHKREVNGLQECLYKKTPTPIKNDQLRRLQEDIQMKDSEILKLQKEVLTYKLQHKMHEQSVSLCPTNNERSTRTHSKDDVDGAEIPLGNKKAKPKSTPYKVSRKQLTESDGNYSDEQDIPKRSTRKTTAKKNPQSGNKTRKAKENDPDAALGISQKSQSKRIDTPMPGSKVKAEPVSIEKSQKKKPVAKKKLFSHSDSLVEVEPDESQDAPLSTTILNPLEYVKRNLRSRPNQ